MNASFFFSTDHDCSYLPGLKARNIFLDPETQVDARLYQNLLNLGFRRSDKYLYRPQCIQCSKCIALRIPVNEFSPNRSQRRCWKKNTTKVTAKVLSGEDLVEHQALFSQYIQTRHPSGEMDGDSMEFLVSPWATTECYEFSTENHPIAVAVTDVLPDGLSAVYTFFDTKHPLSGMGIYAILWQIEHAKSLGLKWLYLGYWIKDCQKMNYKDLFRPLDAWDGEQWLRFNKGQEIEFPGTSSP